MALSAPRALSRLMPALCSRGIHSSASLCGGAGAPVGSHIIPTAELPESDELVWDDGSPYPEPCPDVVAPHISEMKGLAMWAGALSFFVVVGTAANLDNKAARVPWVQKEIIGDNPYAILDK